MSYSVIVADSVTRTCIVEVDAENEEDAVQKATDMWDSGELDGCMRETNDEPDFVNAYCEDS